MITVVYYKNMASFRRNGNKLDMINSMQIVEEMIYTKREINKDVASFCNHNKEVKNWHWLQSDKFMKYRVVIIIVKTALINNCTIFHFNDAIVTSDKTTC